MDDSNFPSQLKRSLYRYRKTSVLILRSRTFTTAKNIKVVIKAPRRFAGKAARLILSNPGRLVEILSGRRTIQNTSEDQDRLTAEYQQWIENEEKANLDIVAQQKQAQDFKYQPLVSLITPIFNPPVDAHNELIESVVNQTYANFELLLFNFGDDNAVKELLDSWARKDKRIVVKHGLKNGGISRNSNLILKSATGDYVALLDHDDALRPNALFECVKVINENGAEFIYTDKDKITEDGIRHEAFFKPDWSPEMLLGGNYLTHFDLMKTELVRRIGGWDPKTDGAQDWDLFLRLLDETDKIAHVPQIVYHWRTVKGSTASSMSVKPYALEAQRRAVNKHLKRHNLPGEAKHDDAGQMYIHWEPRSDSILAVLHMEYGDVGHVEGTIKQMLESGLPRGSRIVVCSVGDEIGPKQIEKLQTIDPKADILKYEPGEFAQKLTDYVKHIGIDRIVYVSDSEYKVSNVIGNSSWLNQICGWLTIPGVGMAGGAVYAENGQLIDVGSFLDPVSRNFEKYYFATGFRSGYNGYIQWIRNFLLPSERLFAFRSELIDTKEWKSLARHIRDDEFVSALGLVNYKNNLRAVYDPSISSIDNAPYYLVIPPSPSLSRFIDKECAKLKQGDPYYNPNLDACYMDPKPRYAKIDMQKREAVSGQYHVRSTEAPNY